MLSCSCGARYVKWVGRCRCGLWNSLVEEAVVSKKEKADWYELQIWNELKNGKCKCENCGVDVRGDLKSKEIWIRRGCISHILPKSNFASVATNVNNYMVQCLNCHSQWGTSWLNASKMPCFSIAKKKYQLFKNLITESKTKIEKYFES